MTDYSKLKRLAEAATAGPWVSGGNWVSTVRGNSVADCPRGDEEFIAAANPTAVLGLLAENEALERAYAIAGECEHELRVERETLRKAVAYAAEMFSKISSGDGSGHADLARAVWRIAGPAMSKEPSNG